MNNPKHLRKSTGTLAEDDISHISIKALQIMTDKQNGWEFLFFAELLNDYIKECENVRRDLLYGNPLGERIPLENPIQVSNWIKKHLSLLESIIKFMVRLVNEEYPIAIGKPGQSGDAKHIHYIAKRFIEGYKSIIEWRLTILTIDVDPSFSELLNLTSNLASNAIKETEAFVIRFHKQTNEIFHSPDSDEKKAIKFNIDLGIPDSREFDNEIKRIINMFDEEGFTANDAEDISDVHEIRDEQSGTQSPQTAYAKEGKIGKSPTTTVKKSRASVERTLAYKIVDDRTFENAIRIKTKWKGKNRLLWIDKNDIDEFLAHPENFKEIPKLVDSGKQWYETGGRIKMGSGGTVLRWNAVIVKKVGFFRWLFG